MRAHVAVEEQGEKKSLNSPGGEELMKKWGGGGAIPFFVFLNPQGELVVNSIRPKDPDGKHGGNIGHPAEPYEIDYFLTMLEKAAPQMTVEERGGIEGRLRAQKK